MTISWTPLKHYHTHSSKKQPRLTTHRSPTASKSKSPRRTGTIAHPHRPHCSRRHKLLSSSQRWKSTCREVSLIRNVKSTKICRSVTSHDDCEELRPSPRGISHQLFVPSGLWRHPPPRVLTSGHRVNHVSFRLSEARECTQACQRSATPRMPPVITRFHSLCSHV